MKRFVGLTALLIMVLTVTPAVADFYVIAGSGRLGTAITTVPVPINSSGSYYLTQNLTCSANVNAITVHADDVTIDLNGFCLTGPGKGSGEGNNGIVVAQGHTNVEIRNGSIKGFGGYGIYTPSGHSGTRVVGVRVRDTGKSGIWLLGNDHLVMDCTVRNTGEMGIVVGYSSLVKGSQTAGNTSAGINVGLGSTAVGNTARGNGGGILAGPGASVTDNTVSGQSSWGISAYDDCTITRNTVYNNTGTGINTGTYCTITNNTTDGLTNGANCTLANNTVTP
ncbi:MAG: right-handed parallel beta-helix repeat-containing protein [Desulfobaccales bacterium]